MTDRHLAEIYGVPTRNLNRAVRRNLNRFPADFMFQLDEQEWEILKCQIGTSRWGGDRRAPPFVFTELGVAMLSSVLHSQRAVDANILIMRAFVRLRKALSIDKSLARKLRELESRLNGHDKDVHVLFSSIRRLLDRPEKRRPRIGFKVDVRTPQQRRA